MKRHWAVIADSHFREGPRYEECWKLHAWIVDDIAARGARLGGISGILHAGDVYDQKSSPEERMAVSAFVRNAASIAPVVIVRGNHDAVDDLLILERLATRFPVVVEQGAGVHYIGGRLAIAAVAWPRKAALLAATGAEGKEAGEQAAGDALRAVFRGLHDQLQAHDGPKFLLMHAMVRGSLTSTGQPLVGCDLEVGLEDLALLNADAYLLGHIHKQQDWEIAGAPVIYPGSPRRTAFGEEEAKGYVMVEYDDETKAVTWEFIEAPATPMVHLTCEHTAAGIALPEANVAGAEVRLRYSVASDRREAADTEAQRIREELLTRGAVSVKLEPVVTVETRARTPEVARAQTLQEKLVAYWESKSFEPGKRRAPLLSKLGDLEEAEGGTLSATRSAGSVRLRKWRMVRMGPFEDFTIDLDAIGAGPLIAITGPNGAGKSTALQLGLPGPMYRDTPTRGTLVDLAYDRASMLEVSLEYFKPWVLRHLIDGVARKSEAVVLDEAGNAVLDSSKVSEFDKWAAQNLPPPQVLFSCQFGSGFVALKPAERKSALLRILGMERLEVLAEQARAHASDAKKAQAVAAARLADHAGKVQPVAEAEETLRASEAAERRLAQDVELHRGALAAAEARATQIAEAKKAAGAEEIILADLKSKQQKALERQLDLERRVANNRTVLENAEDIRSAVLRVEELKSAIHDVELRAADANGRVSAWRERFAAASRDLKSTEERLQILDRQLRGAAEVREHAATAAGLRERLEVARAEVEQAEQAVRYLDGAALVNAEGRIEHLRHGLSEIAAIVDDGTPHMSADLIAQEALDTDDQAVKDATERPKLYATAREKLSSERVKRTSIEASLRAAEAAEAKVPALEELEAQQFGAEAEKADRETRLQFVEAQKPAAADGFDEVLRKHRAELAKVESLASRAEPLAQAEARIEAYLPQLDAARQEVIDYTEQLSVRPAIVVPEPVDTAPASERLQRAVVDHRDAVETVALRKARLEEAKANAERLADLEADLEAVEGDLADWNRLAADLGKDGLQAVEIDSAREEITTQANDLLHACHGPRWTLRLDTQRLSGDGKRLLEALDIVVLDTERGREGLIETYSDGEKHLLSEATSLGLTMTACRRAGVDRPTLIRDEAAGVLDPSNARAYVQMLRLAARLINADKILVVFQQPEIAELCDASINLLAPAVGHSATEALKEVA